MDISSIVVLVIVGVAVVWTTMTYNNLVTPKTQRFQSLGKY